MVIHFCLGNILRDGIKPIHFRCMGVRGTQPGLPMKKGRCGTLTHDNKRNGTTTLFAALNTLNGTSSPRRCLVLDMRSGSISSNDWMENRIRRGVSRSVQELESAIQTYITSHNASPMPASWTSLWTTRSLSRPRRSRDSQTPILLS